MSTIQELGAFLKREAVAAGEHPVAVPPLAQNGGESARS
jgi:hypothetical protein